MCWTSPGCRSGWCRRTAGNGKPLQGSTQRSMAFRWWERKKKSLEIGAITVKNAGSAPAVLTGNPRRRIPYPLPAERRNCVDAEPVKLANTVPAVEASFAGCGSTEGGQPFVAGCRGGSALLGSRGNAHWQVKGSRPIGSRVKRLAQR